MSESNSPREEELERLLDETRERLSHLEEEHRRATERESKAKEASANRRTLSDASNLLDILRQLFHG